MQGEDEWEWCSVCRAAPSTMGAPGVECSLQLLTSSCPGGFTVDAASVVAAGIRKP